ncbi:MAG TPA: vanadium-dependent haloperoxidase [Gemmatimonadaceae bacterium]|nr:vanadium-dependent haloperoxidase [Gemmatimonadaceae bacterium]
MHIFARTTRQFTALALVAGAAACSPDSSPNGGPPTGVSALWNTGGVPGPDAASALAAVRAGNQQLVTAAPALVPPGAPLAPFIEARLYAIGNVAMHDALNAIVPRYDRYADTGPIIPEANPAAAVLAAAHDAMLGAVPAAQPAVDAWYAAQRSALGNPPGLAEGIALGGRVASAILARRANDGTAGGGVAPYVPGSNPGDYQFTFPFDTPGFDFFGTGGFADGSVWGSSVTPFVVQSTAQFRAPPPYGATSNAAAVLTARYTQDYTEVQALGCDVCIARTAEQAEIAKFWVENSPAGWNRIAGIVAAQRQLDAWEAARLFALLQMGEFDSYASSLESKYHYNFWRPVTAVARAATDGNPRTQAAAGWDVLVFPTPPIPDYPSAHAEAGGTAAAVIEAVVPGKGPRIATTSASLPFVTRTFASVAEAAQENADSRIYVGYHFRLATEVGLGQGRLIGEYIAANALRRRMPR